MGLARKPLVNLSRGCEVDKFDWFTSIPVPVGEGLALVSHHHSHSVSFCALPSEGCRWKVPYTTSSCVWESQLGGREWEAEDSERRGMYSLHWQRVLGSSNGQHSALRQQERLQVRQVHVDWWMLAPPRIL